MVWPTVRWRTVTEQNRYDLAVYVVQVQYVAIVSLLIDIDDIY